MEEEAEPFSVFEQFVNHFRGKHVLRYEFFPEEMAKPDAPLFEGKRGPMTRQGLQKAWKAAVRRAGLPADYSIHSARHTVATALLRKTKNLVQVQKQLGHTNPSTTANLYCGVSFDDMQNGMRGLFPPPETEDFEDEDE